MDIKQLMSNVQAIGQKPQAKKPSDANGASPE
jgi:hypothetical protein